MPDEATNYFRVPGWLRQQAGLGRIGADARAPARTAYGLAIENVERGFFHTQVNNESNYTGLSSTTWVDVDATLLSWSVTTSGRRPVELTLVTRIIGSAGREMGASLAWDGVEVTGVGYGMCHTFDNAFYHQTTGRAVLDSPGGGTHRLSVVYKVSGGVAAGLLVNGKNRLFVSVKEI